MIQQAAEVSGHPRLQHLFAAHQQRDLAKRVHATPG